MLHGLNQRFLREQEKIGALSPYELRRFSQVKLNNMMKQAQRMQAQMMEIQEKLGEETVEASVGGGMVKAVFTGQGALVEIRIDPEVIKPEEREMLEDLVTAAVNEGLLKSKELANARMGAVTGALGSLGLGF